MKLRKVILENFRSYKGRHEIEIDDITAFIGCNDAGKSTILEALDIFFNNARLDINDKCIEAEDDYFAISCVFEKFTNEIVLDDSIKTTFAQEYLLNAEGFLEICKKYPCGSSLTTKSIKKYIIANHPSGEFSDLHSKTQKQLQVLCKTKGLSEDINNTINSEMRHALWQTIDKIEDTLVETKINEYLDEIEQEFPIYSLFKVDRDNTDQDSDIQNPFKLAIKNAVSEVESQLTELSNEIIDSLSAISEETINKLKEINPSLANGLNVEIPAPKWESLFKISLKDDKNIDINKRGSGTRRLLLFSFFRAQAEMQCTKQKRSLIIAIEEPETAQHPDNQNMIINTLIKLVEEQNYQILLTTHTPEIAGKLPKETLRFVTNDPDIKVKSGKVNTDIYTQICKTLGLHSMLDTSRLKLVIFTEGPLDVEFIRSISKNLHAENPNIIDLSQDNPNFAFLPFGGDNLNHHAKKEYYLSHQLGNLSVKHFGFVDKEDNDKHKKAIKNFEEKGIHIDILSKRTIENYLHSNPISEIFGITMPTFNDNDLVANIVADQIKTEQHDNPKQLNPKSCKRILNSDVANKMTLDLLKEKDPEGEILGILSKIKDLLQQ